MAKKIFVNLPVKDLKKTIAFFTKLGYKFNPEFTDETATCMLIGKNIFAMLMTHEKFKTFVKKPISDANKTVQVINALELGSKKEVDEMIKKAFKNGATEYMKPYDYGWMYGNGFADLDGHLWEFFFFDEKKRKKAFAKMKKEAKK